MGTRSISLYLLWIENGDAAFRRDGPSAGALRHDLLFCNIC